MVDAITKVAELSTSDLTSEERRLLEVAYRNKIRTYQAAWKKFVSLEKKEE